MRKILIAVVSVFSMLACAPAYALDVWMSTGVTVQPLDGWQPFCKTYPAECYVDPLPKAEIKLTTLGWRTIAAINHGVNKRIKYIRDRAHWNLADKWDFAEDGSGDCEDYAFLKRRLLIKAGFPRQAILMTITRAQKEDEEAHAMLTIVTDKGDFVLDDGEVDKDGKKKSTRQIYIWYDAPYSFRMRQSQEDPNRWVEVKKPSPVASAAH